MMLTVGGDDEEGERFDMAMLTLPDGGRLHIKDTGMGRHVVVMVHGWSSTQRVYAKPVILMRGKLRCITYDQRGHGRSRGASGEHVTTETLASDLQELLVSLGLTDVILLGWSMGASVVMNYLMRYGTARLDHVVLCDMTPKLMSDKDWELGIYQGQYTQSERMVDETRPFFMQYREFAVRSVPRLRKLPAALLSAGCKMRLSHCDVETLESLADSMKEQDLRGSLTGLDVPLTYFYADPGTLFSPELATWYAQNVPTPFRAVRFEDATHMLVEEQPVKFAKEVLSIALQVDERPSHRMPTA